MSQMHIGSQPAAPEPNIVAGAAHAAEPAHFRFPLFPVMPRRRAKVLLTKGWALAVLALVASTSSAPARAEATAPVKVDMEAVVKAAQWDPVKADDGITPGARTSVRLVERALQAKGLLAPTYVDGHFGSQTVKAYMTWQRSLGYTGLGANGLPGRASLTKLGQGRFVVTRPLSTGSRRTYTGFPVNTRTLAMLHEAEKRWGRAFVLEQGSYSPGFDPTSSGTHDGGGALDLDAGALTPRRRHAAVRALREVGFAAWLRTPAQADWPWHIHAIAISDTDLSRAAQEQVGKYYEGRNGLHSDLPDKGPRVAKVTWEEYQRAH